MNYIKRIALLIFSIERGGMERVASQLSFMLNDMGYGVYLIVSHYNRKTAYEYAGKLIECPFTICKESKKGELLSYYYNSLMLKEIKKKYKVDTTISFAQEANLINMLTRTNDKKILTIHNCMSLRMELNGCAYTKAAIRLYNRAYLTVTVSDWCKNDLVENYGLKKEKVQTIYNPSTQEYGCTQNIKKPIILYVGRLDAVKQPWHAIKAFAKVKEQIQTAELWLAGDGPEQGKLKQLIKKLNLEDSVKLLGFVKDVNALYDEAKVFVMTSKSEAFPCVLVETLGHGVPAVISDIAGGAKECISKGIGYISDYPKEVEAGIITKDFEFSEPYSLALTKEEIMMGNEIARLLLDDELYRAKVNACEELLNKFKKTVIAKQWENIL